MALKYDDPFSDLPADTPVYRLLKDCFMEDDTLHPEDEIVAFTGIPNEYMEPLNEPARRNMGVFLAHLDKCGREAAERAGRPYTGRITDLGDQIEQAMKDAKSGVADPGKLNFTMPTKQDVPQRPDLIPQALRKPKANKKLLASKAPPQQGKPTPRPIHIQGKDYDEAAGGTSSLS